MICFALQIISVLELLFANPSLTLVVYFKFEGLGMSSVEVIDSPKGP